MLKCDTCPLANADHECRGQHPWRRRLCELADPTNPAYNPRYIALLDVSGATAVHSQGEPGLLQRAANFAGAVATHVAAGMPTATPEQQAARLAICRTNECGYYRQGDRCGHSGCGCYLTVKVSWADQSCPLEPPMWGPVTATGAQER